MGTYSNNPYAGSRSRGPVTFEIKHQDKLDDIFEKLPAQYAKKPVIATFRKGANEVKKAMRSELPGYLKVTKKIISAKAGKSKNYPSLSVGFFGRKAIYVNSKGQQWDPFMLVYWHNYGTLANRQPGHPFKKARKAKSSNMQGGIRPRLFVEKAIQASHQKALQVVENEFEDQLMKFLKKHAVQ